MESCEVYMETLKSYELGNTEEDRKDTQRKTKNTCEEEGEEGKDEGN